MRVQYEFLPQFNSIVLPKLSHYSGSIDFRVSLVSKECHTEILRLQNVSERLPMLMKADAKQAQCRMPQLRWF